MVHVNICVSILQPERSSASSMPHMSGAHLSLQYARIGISLSLSLGLLS